MTEAERDTQRAIAAAKAIFDERHPTTHHAEIMVTAEHAIATVLLGLYGTPVKAVQMLNEGLVIGVERRLSLYQSKMEC